MFARVTTTKGQVTKEDAVRVIRDRVLSRAKDVPGFKGGLWLLDEKGGNGLTITLFESEEALRLALRRPIACGKKRSASSVPASPAWKAMKLS